MLTKSAKKIISGLAGGAQIPPATSSNVYIVPIKDINGSKRYILAGTPYAASSNNLITTQMRSVTGVLSNNRSATVGFAIGSDGTPPTEDDYTLGNQIIGFTASSPVIKTDEVILLADEIKYIITYDWLVKNNTGNEIVIREMGMFHVYGSGANRGDTKQTSSNQAFANEASVMIDRIVLDDTVTIPNGESGAVRYEFVYDWTNS